MNMTAKKTSALCLVTFMWQETTILITIFYYYTAFLVYWRLGATANVYSVRE